MSDHRIALVHDWLTGMRGGERVLEAFVDLFPRAHLFTLFKHAGSVSRKLDTVPTTTSFLQRAPFLRRHYRYYLPLFPRAVRSLDLSGFSIVVSSSHCVAKGVRIDPGAIHVCYCHTPMRYAWDRFDDYFGREAASPLTRFAARSVMRRMRRWDASTAPGVDLFLANSQHVADRIERCYGRTSHVIPPPVDTERFRPGPDGPGDRYLLVAALVPTKRVDRALDAFRGSGRRLLVVGDGPNRGRLERRAGSEVTFAGHLPESDLVRAYQSCRALVVPGAEDAGITPLEAMACGRPVIALDRGGVPEVIRIAGDGSPTGVLFDDESPGGLADALERLEASEADFDPAAIRRHAEQFDVLSFRRRFQAALEAATSGAPLARMAL